MDTKRKPSISKETSHTDNDWLPVIDDEGAVIGKERRAIVHRTNLKHQSTHAAIFNSRGELLIQLRAPHKDTFPECWDLSVTGHVDVGETFEQALAREMREEIGLTLGADVECRFLREILPSALTGWERVREYTGVTDATPHPNPNEIIEVAWIMPERLREEIKSGARRVTPVLCDTLECLVLKK